MIQICELFTIVPVSEGWNIQHLTLLYSGCFRVQRDKKRCLPGLGVSPPKSRDVRPPLPLPCLSAAAATNPHPTHPRRPIPSRRRSNLDRLPHHHPRDHPSHSAYHSHHSCHQLLPARRLCRPMGQRCYHTTTHARLTRVRRRGGVHEDDSWGRWSGRLCSLHCVEALPEPRCRHSGDDDDDGDGDGSTESEDQHPC
jgi:hypothetical protein